MEISEWVVLLALMLVGIFSLVLASGAEGRTGEGAGILIAAVAAAGVLWRIKHHFDRIDAGRH